MQAPQDMKVINLEPLGGGKVSANELSNTVTNIINEIKRLRGEQADSTGSEPAQPTPQEPAKPSFNFGSVKKYALYGGGALAAIYLIGKALE